MEKAIGQSADAVIATCSDEMTDLLWLGIARQRLHPVPYGVDLEQFTPDGPASPRGDLHRLLYLGQFLANEHQEVDTVIRAMELIPDTELVVAGGPPASEVGTDRDIVRLRHAAEEALVDRRVTFLGQVAHKAVPKLIRSADVVVNVPAYESLGLVPLEAMACGVPVATTPVGGQRDNVLAGVTGVEVPPDQPAAIARRIRGLLAEPTRRAALGIAGTDRARARYSWSRIARETVQVYEHALATARTKPSRS